MHALVFGFVVDQNAVHILGEKIAHSAFDEIRIAKGANRRGLIVDALFDGFPSLLEHREVAHDVYHAIYGHGIYSYLYRIWAFFYAVKHIRGHVQKVQAYLLEKDREGMTAQEREASVAREKHVAEVTGKRALQHLRKIVSPFYKPADRREPRGLTEVLDRYARPPREAATA